MKKVLSIVMAMMLVVALSVNVFADIDLTGAVEAPANANQFIEIPAGVDVSNGAIVTLAIKGTSDNTAVRFYLSDANDVGRVTDVVTVDVLGGSFDKTIELVINYDGGFGGSAAPTHLIVKGPDYATPLANTTFEVLSIAGVDAAEEAPAEEPAPETEAPAEEPAPETEAPAEEPAPETEAPAETGVALAVIPAIVAMAAVVISKKR